MMVMMTRWKMHCTVEEEEEEVKFAKKSKGKKEKKRKKIMKQLCDGARSYVHVHSLIYDASVRGI